MTEKTWTWVLNSFEEQNPELPMYPVLLIKSNFPYKLFYAEGKILKVKTFPTLSEISKIFTNNPNIQTKNTFATGFLLDNSKEIISESQFLCEIYYSKYIAIQLQRNKDFKTFYHKIEFRLDHYNSFLYNVQNNKRTLINNITIEKQILRLSKKVVLNIENSSEKIVNSIELVYFQNDSNVFFLETIEKCVVKEDQSQFSIEYCTVVANSIESNSQSQILRKNLSYIIKPTFSTIKPKFKIKNKLNTCLALFPLLKNSTQNLNFCHGSYCDKQINFFSIQKKRKVLFQKYKRLPHDSIKTILNLLIFPMDEADFDERFDKIFEEFLLTSFKRPKEKNLNMSMKYDKELVTLCPVCFKIFSKLHSKNQNFSIF